MPAEAIMTIGIANDEGNVRVQHNREDSVVVIKHPMKSIALQVKES